MKNGMLLIVVLHKYVDLPFNACGMCAIITFKWSLNISLYKKYIARSIPRS